MGYYVGNLREHQNRNTGFELGDVVLNMDPEETV